MKIFKLYQNKQVSKEIAQEIKNDIELARQGNRPAFERLILRYEKEIFATLYRLTADRQEAEDITQETFFRAYQTIQSWRTESNFRAWVYRVALNLYRNQVKFKQVRKTDDFGNGEPDVILKETVFVQNKSPEEIIDKKEVYDLITRAIDRLPVEYKQVLILRELQGFSYSEIAGTLKISVGTVKSRIARARECVVNRINPTDKKSGIFG